MNLRTRILFIALGLIDQCMSIAFCFPFCFSAVVMSLVLETGSWFLFCVSCYNINWRLVIFQTMICFPVGSQFWKVLSWNHLCNVKTINIRWNNWNKLEFKQWLGFAYFVKIKRRPLSGPKTYKSCENVLIKLCEEIYFLVRWKETDFLSTKLWLASLMQADVMQVDICWTYFPYILGSAKPNVEYGMNHLLWWKFFPRMQHKFSVAYK